ncbi:MAG TPA: site-2 protease family protein [Candidatus Acidoferrales bacterium]|nr:site-2 protease family protein [Candidatus Acidoferrales bacterium]
MTGLRQGSIHLFRAAGIDVYLHWSWFLVVAYEIQDGTRTYSSLSWNTFEYVGLFLIVMIHEFGHALACRQVGGTSNQIILWPLGGIAYVNPPPRPGATLWSIAAGPLVNVALVPILWAPGALMRQSGLAGAMPETSALLHTVWIMNLVLLIFNLLPIYPLDGGQILRALLWYVLGRARSLMVATIIGFAGVAGLIALAVWRQSAWFGVIAVFVTLNCWNGLRAARALSRMEKMPRREGFSCPSCGEAPPEGDYWKCTRCTHVFDTFQYQGVCPLCAARFDAARCLNCGALHPMREWIAPAGVAVKV